MTLKLATKEDREDVIRLLSDFHSISPYKSVDFSHEKVGNIFDAYLSSDKTDIIVILSVQDSKNVGLIVGVSEAAPFSDEKMAMELAWYVDPEYRGSRDSLELMMAYQDWSKRVGAKITQMALLDDVTDLRKFYTRQGYRPAEHSFIKET